MRRDLLGKLRRGRLVIGDGVLEVVPLAIQVATLKIPVSLRLKVDRGGVVDDRPVDLAGDAIIDARAS
jgi:hypothetical protein